MKIYLAGPMSGYDEFNFPAFEAAAKKLREQGHHVFSPAEADDIYFGSREEVTRQYTEDRDAAFKKCMRVDLGYIMDHAEGIALLPGWEKSKGALAELALARCFHLEEIYIE